MLARLIQLNHRVHLFSGAFRSCRLAAISNIVAICSGASLACRRDVTLSVLDVHLDNVSAKLGSLLEVTPISRLQVLGSIFQKYPKFLLAWSGNNALMLVLGVEKRNKLTLLLKDASDCGY